MSDLRIACELQGWILIEKDSSEKMHNVTQWKSGKQAKIYDGILTSEEFNLRFIFANSANKWEANVYIDEKLTKP